MKETGGTALRVTSYYLLWFVSCGLSFLNFVVALNAIRHLAILLGADQWILPAVHRFSLLGLGAILVVFFFWSEAHYRKASRGGLNTLLRTFGFVTAVQIILLSITYLIPRIPA